MTHQHRALIDAGLVLVLGALFFLSGRPDDLAGVAIGLLYVGALLWRRSSPLAVALVATAAYAAWILAGYTAHQLGALPAAVAVYALGQSEESHLSKAVGVGFLVGAFLVIAVGMTGMDLLGATFFVLIFLGVWAVGVVVAGRRRYIDELEQRTMELEAARRALANQAIAEERARIARELHDVVSHSLSTITLQAGVGAHLADSNPARALESLKNIESIGRTTLGELRRVLGTIQDETSDKHPQPSLGDVGSLVQRVEESGLPVELSEAGTPSRLPQIVELSVYRIVQESLTNVLKHAPGVPVRVGIDHRPDGIEVEIVSNGPPAAGENAGVGLKGMAERVSSLGGTFEAGPCDEGWRVWAQIPGGVT